MKLPAIHIYKSGDLNHIIKFLFILTLLLLPYDAIKIMPSLYKPICLIPAALLFIILIPNILQNGFSKPAIILSFFAVIATFNTIVMNFVIGSFENFFDFFITLCLFYVSFLSMSTIFTNICERYGKKYAIHFFFKMIAIAYIFPTIVAVIDTMVVYKVLPYAIKNIIRTVFGGNQPDRITGTTFECSWLTYHLLLSSVSYLYMFRKTFFKRYLLLLLMCFGCFVLSISLQGYAVFGAFLIIYLLANIKKIRIKYLIIGASLITAIVVASIVVINQYKDSNYFINRIKNFVDIHTLFRTDLSTFIRVGYPLLGLRMFLDYPLLGVGGSNFGIHLGNYITRYYPWAILFYGNNENEVYWNIISNNGNPKMFYIRLLCEFGIIPAILFAAFFYQVVKKKSTDEYTKILICLVPCFLLQFDSLCFALFIIPLSFYSALPVKKRYKRKRVIVKESSYKQAYSIQ